MRQWRLTNDSIIDKNLFVAYINEAISNEKRGMKIKSVKKRLIIPIELKQVFNDNKKIAKFFEILSLGKKREFANYISEAKREATKIKRIEKIIPMIINNIGLHDKYKTC